MAVHHKVITVKVFVCSSGLVVKKSTFAKFLIITTLLLVWLDCTLLEKFYLSAQEKHYFNRSTIYCKLSQLWLDWLTDLHYSKCFTVFYIKGWRHSLQVCDEPVSAVDDD